MVDIIKDFIPAGAKNRPGRPMTPKYITVHNTGNAASGADALGHAVYLKGGSAGSTGWHFTVDDKRAVQHIPTTETASSTSYYPNTWKTFGNQIQTGFSLHPKPARSPAFLLISASTKL